MVHPFPDTQEPTLPHYTSTTSTTNTSSKRLSMSGISSTNLTYNGIEENGVLEYGNGDQYLEPLPDSVLTDWKRMSAVEVDNEASHEDPDPTLVDHSQGNHVQVMAGYGRPSERSSTNRDIRGTTNKHNRSNSEGNIQHKKQRHNFGCSEVELDIVDELLNVIFKASRFPKTDDIKAQVEFIQRVMKIKVVPRYVNDWFAAKNQESLEREQKDGGNAEGRGGPSPPPPPAASAASAASASATATRSHDSLGSSQPIWSPLAQSTVTKTETAASGRTIGSKPNEYPCPKCHEDLLSRAISTWHEHDLSHFPLKEYYCLMCRIQHDNSNKEFPWKCVALKKCRSRFKTWEDAVEHTRDKQIGCGMQRKSRFTREKEWDAHLDKKHTDCQKHVLSEVQINSKTCFRCTICTTSFNSIETAKAYDCETKSKWAYDLPFPDKCIDPLCAAITFESRKERWNHYEAEHHKKPILSTTQPQRPPAVPFAEALNGLVRRDDDPDQAGGDVLEEVGTQPPNSDVFTPMAQVDKVLP